MGPCWIDFIPLYMLSSGRSNFDLMTGEGGTGAIAAVGSMAGQRGNGVTEESVNGVVGA
jgi:hypothetical protein